MMMRNIIALKKPSPTGNRYLRAKRRDYSYWDIFHPRTGFLCQLLSRPLGYQVTNPSPECQHLEDRYYQTVQIFEKDFLRSGRLS